MKLHHSSPDTNVIKHLCRDGTIHDIYIHGNAKFVVFTHDEYLYFKRLVDATNINLKSPWDGIITNTDRVTVHYLSMQDVINNLRLLIIAECVADYKQEEFMPKLLRLLNYTPGAD